MGKKKNPPRQAANEARAQLRMLRVSPQKLNLLAQSIRGLSAEKALNSLSFRQSVMRAMYASCCKALSPMPKTIMDSI